MSKRDEWKLNTYQGGDVPDLMNYDDTVEIQDDGALLVETDGGLTVYVPGPDMHKLIEAWKQRQEQLRRDAVEPVSALKGGGS